MANSRDFTGKNRKFTGTGSIITPKGTTGQRVGSESGELRFNTTIELMEYYDGTQWKPIDAPPTISGITTNDATGTSTILNADGSTLFTITINGGNFSISPTVKFIGSTGTEYSAGNVTRVSSSQITCTTLSSMGTTDDPYDIEVTNTSGLSATLDDAFSYNEAPVFVTASGQLGTVYNTQVISGSTFNASATDAEGNTITYSILSGSLPGSGLTLSSSTGMITGTLSGAPSLGNYSFIVQASTAEGVINRQFSIQVIAVPAITVDFLVIAGGGGGGNGRGGGGGAGGYRNSYSSETSGGGGSSETELSFNPGTVYTITVGNGGAKGPSSDTKGSNGTNSSISGSDISTITSTAGGGGGAYSGAGQQAGNSGGSGGGSGDSGSGGAGTANQGYAGGNAGGGSNGAGGGGAGAVGGSGQGGAGGNGLASSITGSSVSRGGGGGGGGDNASGAGGSGGGGAGSSGGGTSGAGSVNTGGGGGGSGYSGGGGTAGDGGKGVVILRMPTNRYSGTTTGSPTVTTSGSDTILVFNSSGSITG